MSSCLQRDAQNLRDRAFSSPNQDAAPQLQDIDDHEEQHAVAPLVRQALHSRVQLRDAWLKGGRTGRLDSSDANRLSWTANSLQSAVSSASAGRSPSSAAAA